MEGEVPLHRGLTADAMVRDVVAMAAMCIALIGN